MRWRHCTCLLVFIQILAFLFVSGMNNVTKHIMTNSILLSQATAMLEEIKGSEDDTDYRVAKMIRRIQGQHSVVFSSRGDNGTCKMLGRPTAFENYETDRCLLSKISQFCGHNLKPSQAFYFRRARTETGIFIRGDVNSNSTCRNETIIMDSAGVVIRLAYLVGVVSTKSTEIIGTFACGWEMTEPDRLGAIPKIGTKSVKVPHIFCLNKAGQLIVRNTCDVDKQMIILFHDLDTENVLLSLPSNRFRPT